MRRRALDGHEAGGREQQLARREHRVRELVARQRTLGRAAGRLGVQHAQRVAHRVDELVHKRRAEALRARAARCKRTAVRVRGVCALAVQRRVVWARIDALQHDRAMGVNDLLVHVVAQRKDGLGRDGDAQRARPAARWVVEHDADLGLLDAQALQALAVALDEHGEHGLHVLERVAERVQPRHKDV